MRKNRRAPVERKLLGDHRLLKARQLTIREIEEEGQQVVINPLFSGCKPTGLHDWSRCQEDVKGEDAYQFCIDCGKVRRAPAWFPRSKPGR